MKKATLGVIFVILSIGLLGACQIKIPRPCQEWGKVVVYLEHQECHPTTTEITTTTEEPSSTTSTSMPDSSTSSTSSTTSIVPPTTTTTTTPTETSSTSLVATSAELYDHEIPTIMSQELVESKEIIIPEANISTTG